MLGGLVQGLRLIWNRKLDRSEYEAVRQSAAQVLTELSRKQDELAHRVETVHNEAINRDGQVSKAADDRLRDWSDRVRDDLEQIKHERREMHEQNQQSIAQVHTEIAELNRDIKQLLSRGRGWNGDGK